MQQLDRSRRNYVNIAKGAVNLVVGQLRTLGDKVEQEAVQRQKANARANRNTQVPLINNTARLQEALYNIGAYGGLKDKEGNDLTFEKAVDGIRGKMTDAAIAKALSMGYDIDETKGVVSRRTESGDSPNQNLQAIIDHKVRYNVDKPYIVVDKKKNLMSVYKKDQLLNQYEVTTGAQKGDGWYPLENNKSYWKQPMTTGAGIFTVRPTRSSKYLGKEPMLMLYAGDVRTTAAIHSPATLARKSLLNNGNAEDNRASYGCISPNCGVIKGFRENRLINRGDSVYVLPESEGNYIYEEDGRIKTHFGGNNPTEFVSPRGGFKGKFNYNTNY